MKINRITIEQALFFLILLVALGVRLSNIGVAPLSERESILSLEAFQVSNGESTNFSPGPAYSLLTGATFFLFSDNNSSARIWSVLAGCCLVIFPYLIRSLIGRKAALIMALGLAFDPSLVVFSRMAGSDILAVGFGALALGFIYNRKPIPAGIFCGLMFLSGPAAIQGLLGIGFTWLLGSILSRWVSLEPFPGAKGLEKNAAALRSGVLAAGGVFLVVGTLFFRYPQGLGAVTSIFPAYIEGWINASGIPFSQLPTALLLYSPIALIFGSVAIIQGVRRHESVSLWLGLWAIVSLIIALIYPGRQASDLAWVLVPLWALAAIELAKYFRLEDAEILPALGQAFLIMLLMALGWLNMAGLSLSGGDEQTLRLRWAVIGGTIVLGAVTTFLIGLGWSIKTAQQGLVWGLLLGLGFYGFATMWGISQLRPNGEQDLLAPYPVAKNGGDLLTTLGDLSEWQTSIRDSLDVVVTDSSASLQWELRNWPEARFLTSVPAGELPAVIINSEDQPSPNLSIGYRGQDFAWWASPTWEGTLPENWPSWFVFRNAPLIQSHVILWARGDLFPGGILTPAEEESPPVVEDFPIEERPER
ncbi:glycosyltransferase family 39 protein [Chloroflexota bacterium]